MDQDNQNGRWYEPVNPNEHSYTPGYGFSTRPPSLIEQRLISGYSGAAAFCLLAFFFLASFIPNFLLQLTYRFLPPSTPFAVDEILWQLYLMIGTIVALILPFLGFIAYTRIPRNCALPMRRVEGRILFGALLIAMASGVLGGYANMAADSLFQGMGVDFMSSSEIPASLPGWVLYAINLTVIPAVFEEFAFRGMLMQSLRRFGDSFALVVSAALFALVHIVPTSMPNAFIMGLVIGYFVLFTGSIYTGILIHFVNNLLVLGFESLSWLPEDVLHISLNTMDLVCLLLGFIALIAMLRRYPNLFSLRNSETVNPSEQKLRVFFCTIPLFVFYLAIIFMALRFRI